MSARGGQAYEMVAESTEYVVYETTFSFKQEPLDEKTYLDSKQFFSQRGYACNKTRLVC